MQDSKFKVVIRKRPLLPYEIKQGDFDVISNDEHTMRVHECKLKFDGISKQCNKVDFYADRVFGHLS